MKQPKIGWDYVRPKDVPKRTNGAISTRQVYRWITERRIPFAKTSGTHGPVLVRLSDLEAFVAGSIIPAEDR